MKFSWIFDEFAKSSIDPIETGFVTIQPQIHNNQPLEFRNILKRDNSLDLSIFPKQVNFTFKKKMTIAGYRLQTPYTKRYLKGWNVSLSIDGVSFVIIDSKKENFCFSDYIHDGYIDCGETTTREFPISPTEAKFMKIEMTENDSCGSEWIEISQFDIFSSFTNFRCSLMNFQSRFFIFYMFLLYLESN